ncbi:hypothetical protein [Geodermatophilus sp. SYSU D00815]
MSTTVLDPMRVRAADPQAGLLRLSAVGIATVTAPSRTSVTSAPSTCMYGAGRTAG